jgi:hypothetical protein
MRCLVTALAVLATVASASPALAETPLKKVPPPSSYAPRPSGGPHVYGSPLGPPTVGARRHAARSTRHAAVTPARPAKSRPATTAGRLNPPPAPAPR